MADPYRPTDDWHEGYAAGYDAGLRVARRDIGRDLGKRAPKKARKTSAWHKFNKKFDFRKRKRNESSKDYLSARSKAASRAYKKSKR